MTYPEIFDRDFYKKLLNKKEFHFYNNSLFYNKRQQLVKNYITPESPYDRIMLMYKTGVGKTLAAIGISEEFKKLRKNRLFEKTVIITKNNIIKNVFVNELATKCCEYNEGINTVDKMNEDDLKHFKRGVKNNYNFMTFGSLTNRVLGIKREDGKREIVGDRLTNLSNRVIIIDEFHNILGNESYNAVKKILDASTNFRLVILSATPFIDSIDNLYQISNILNEKQDHISKEEYEKMLKRTSMDLFIKNDIPVLTQEGKKIMSQKLKGKISYIDVNTKDFPRKVFKGTELDGKNSIKIFESIMSDYQSGVYNKVLEEDKADPLYKNSSGISTYAGPIDKDLKKHSSKINAIINEIGKTNGTVFIYSNYVSSKGVKLVSKILNNAGISNVALSESVKKGSRLSLIKEFNSYKNRHGKIIKVLIGSPVLSEGITLKNVRQVHVLEPYWNMGKIDQVVGRAVRRNSHADLPENEREVSIYLHVASPKEGRKKSIDAHKYMLSYNKDRSIKNTERLLKRIAIDCAITRKPGKIDGSRECDYTKCNYTCAHQWKKPAKLDKSTFYSNTRSNKNIVYEILDLFDKKYTLTFTDIKKGVDYDKQEIVKSLNEILAKRILTPKNRIVSFKNGLYISTKNIINSELIPEILFLEMFGRDKIDSKHISEYNKRKVMPSSPVKQRSKGKEKAFKDFSNESIFGTLYDKFGNKDGKFRIVLNEKNKNVKNKRDEIKGKACSSYSKTELKNILEKYTGKKISNIRLASKEEMCNSIYTHLKGKKLIHE